MNNEELEMRLLLMKQSIEQLQEELAPNLKTRDLVLLRYMYSYKEIKYARFLLVPIGYK